MDALKHAFEQKVLKRFPYTVARVFPREFVAIAEASGWLKVEVREDPVSCMLEDMLVQIRGMVYGEDLEPIRYPADWWQAFKERWFPGWLKRRYPVGYCVIDVAAVYPGLYVGEHRGHVTVTREHVEWRGDKEAQ